MVQSPDELKGCMSLGRASKDPLRSAKSLTHFRWLLLRKKWPEVFDRTPFSAPGRRIVLLRYPWANRLREPIDLGVCVAVHQRYLGFRSGCELSIHSPD